MDLEVAGPDEGDGQLPRGEVVYRRICAAMRSGALRPGDRLREEDVARQLGVSRTPVREALGRLLARGLVESSAGRGLVVRNLSTGEVIELYAMREIIEGAAASLAAQQASLPEIANLLDIAGEFRASLDDAQALARCNRRLHEAIYRAAKNRYFDSASRELQDAIALVGPTTYTLQDRPLSAAEEHDQIVKAISKRDATLAEHLARAHIREALRTRLKVLGLK
ncbi:MAG: GntR family transcriptional regulator [Beijerinckiaceae bacterium]|nr:GntR family transcriptional regulator [Beijerinckiaceae bacterium]